MPDDIRRIDYYYMNVPDKPGEGVRILAVLQEAGVNLIGISAFPHGARRSQFDLVPEDSTAFAEAAKAARLKPSKKKSGFLLQGEDRPGAVADIMKRLAQPTSMSRRCRFSVLARVATAECSGSRRLTCARPPKR